MGRRSVAWLIDFILFFSLLFALFSQLAVRDTFGNTCEQLQDADITNVCISVNDDAVFLDDDADSSVLQIFVLAYFVGVFILLQGLTGASPGKLVMGVRVVDPQGRRCGPVKALVRSLLWIIDGAPWFIPGLVAFVTGLTSTGHRRVGDMAASTYVVARSSVGTPIQVGGAAGIPNYAPSGPQSAYGNAWAPNPSAPVSAPPGPPMWDPPQAPAAVPPPLPVPDAEPAPVIDAAPDQGGPQWDAERNTYIQWDANAQHWLAWDDATERWDPI